MNSGAVWEGGGWCTDWCISWYLAWILSVLSRRQRGQRKGHGRMTCVSFGLAMLRAVLVLGACSCAWSACALSGCAIGQGWVKLAMAGWLLLMPVALFISTPLLLISCIRPRFEQRSSSCPPRVRCAALMLGWCLLGWCLALSGVLSSAHTAQHTSCSVLAVCDVVYKLMSERVCLGCVVGTYFS